MLDTYRVLSVRETSLNMVGHIKRLSSAKVSVTNTHVLCHPVFSSTIKKKYHLGKCMEKATPLPGTYLNGQGSPAVYLSASTWHLMEFCFFMGLW